MQVTRVAGALGARIDGVDPRDPAAFDDIKAALLEHEVVFFEGRTSPRKSSSNSAVGSARRRSFPCNDCSAQPNRA